MEISTANSTCHTIEEIKKRAAEDELVWISHDDNVFSYSSLFVLAHTGSVQDLLNSGAHLDQHPHILWKEEKYRLEKHDRKKLVVAELFQQAILNHKVAYFPEILAAVAEYIYYLYLRSDRKDFILKDTTVKEFADNHIHMSINNKNFTAGDILKRIIAKIFTEDFSILTLPKLIKEYPDAFDAAINSTNQTKRVEIENNTITELFNTLIDIPAIHNLIMQQIDETHEKVREINLDFLVAMGKRANSAG